MRRNEVPENSGATFLTARDNSYNSFRITSLAAAGHLTPTESHPYKKNWGRGCTLYRPPVFRTFFQVPYPLTSFFSNSSENYPGGGYLFPFWDSCCGLRDTPRKSLKPNSQKARKP